MRKASYLLVAAAIGGLALTATPGSASPLTPGFIGTNSAVPETTSGLLEKAYYKRHRRHYYYAHRRHHHRRYYANDYYYPNYYYYGGYGGYDDCDGYYGGSYG